MSKCVHLHCPARGLAVGYETSKDKQLPKAVDTLCSRSERTQKCKGWLGRVVFAHDVRHLGRFHRIIIAACSCCCFQVIGPSIPDRWGVQMDL